MHIPHTNLHFGSRLFHIAAPTVWNSLSSTPRSSQTLNTFRKHLKTHLFRLHLVAPSDLSSASDSFYWMVMALNHIFTYFYLLNSANGSSQPTSRHLVSRPLGLASWTKQRLLSRMTSRRESACARVTDGPGVEGRIAEQDSISVCLHGACITRAHHTPSCILSSLSKQPRRARLAQNDWRWARSTSKYIDAWGPIY